MLYFRIVGVLLLAYGLLSIFARDFLFKWTIPRSRRAHLKRPKWDRIKVLTGIALIVVGAYIFTLGR
jgi:hypothetical protein